MTRPSPKSKKEAEERAARVADLQRYRWRVGVVDGYWRVTRAPHGVEQWVTLPEKHPHIPDDPVTDRYEQAAWLKQLLGHDSAVQDLDYTAQAEGRLVYELVILR